MSPVLSGKDDQVLTQLIGRMETASRIWSLKKRRGFATKFRRCDVVTENSFVSNTGDDL